MRITIRGNSRAVASIARLRKSERMPAFFEKGAPAFRGR
jgi:hypothetical protein